MAIYTNMAERVQKVRERIYGKYIAYGEPDEDTMREASKEMDDRQIIVSGLAQLQAITNVLPMEIRGRIGGYKNIAEKKTTRGMALELLRRLDRVDTQLEKYMQKELRKRVKKKVKDSQPKSKAQANKGRSTIGPVGHEIALAAMNAMKKSPDEAALAAQEQLAKLDAIEDPTVEEIQLYGDTAYVYEMFADINNADSKRLSILLDLIQTNWDEGRKEWLSELANRKQWKDGKISNILTGLGKLYKSQAETNIGEGQNNLIANASRELISFYQVTDMLSEGVDGKDGGVFKEMTDDFRKASNSFEWAQLQHKEEMKKVFAEIFGVSGINKEARVQSRLNALAKGNDMGTKVTVSLMYDVNIAVRVAELDAAYKQLQENPQMDSVTLRDKTVSRSEFNDIWDAYREDLASGFEPEGNRLFRHTINRRTGERASVGEMSQLDLAKDWLAVQQTDLKDKYDKSGHDEQYRMELENALDDDTKRLALWMQDTLRKRTPATEALHKQEYGLFMATIENYFPAIFEHRVSKEDTVLTVDGTQLGTASSKPSAHKMRVNHNSRPRRQNAIYAFNHNIMQDSFWQTHAEVMRKWGGVLRDVNVQDAILRSKGKGYLNLLNRWLVDIETQGAAVARAQIESDHVWRMLGKGMALGVLGLKLSTILKNLAAGFNVALGVEFSEILRGLRPGVFKDAREILKSETFQRRLKIGATVATKYALEGGKSGNLVFATSRRLAELGVQGINIADTGINLTMALAYSSKLRELRRQQVDEVDAKAQALDYVDDLMARFAQPTDRLSKSLAENTRMPQAQFIVMFQSEMRKMLAINAMAIRKLTTGKGVQSKAMAAQQLIAQVVLVNAFIHVVSALYGALFRGFGDGDDAEEKFIDELDGKKLAAAMVADSFSGVPVFGAGWQAGVNKLFGEKVFSSTSNPAVRAVAGAGQLVSAGQNWEGRSASDNANAVIRGIQGFASVMPETAVIAQGANITRDMLGFVNNTLNKGLTEDDTFALYRKRIKRVINDVNESTKEESKAATTKYARRQITSLRREQIMPRVYDIAHELPPEERKRFFEKENEKEESSIPKYIIREFIR